MERIFTDQIAEHVGEQVRLSGWFHRLRGMGAVNFLILRDAHGLVQIIIRDEATMATVNDLFVESVIHVTGTVVEAKQAPGGVEIHDPSIEVESPADIPPPFDLFRPDLELPLPTMLDHAPLALRHLKNRATFQISAAAVAGFRGTLAAKDFTEIFTPKLVGTATETGASVFQLDYFGRPAYLAQSPQFYKQMMVGVFERVYEVAPVFRAEQHDTARHINEYVSLDVELGFIQDHTDVMKVLRDVMAGMMTALETDAAHALAQLELEPPKVPDEIPAIHFTEAQKIAAARRGATEEEADLAPGDERALCEWSAEEHGSDFLFVTGYPMRKRPFYTYPDPERPEYSYGFDLLFRGIEIVTGGQRLHLYKDYMAALQAKGEDIADYEGYLECFRHGMPKHGGFAIGLERWVGRLVGAENIRETTLFPRDLNRLSP